MADLNPGERALERAAAVAPPAVRERVAAYGALVRLPNTFTAPPDVLAGAAVAVAAGARPAPVAIAAACLGSLLLYAAGTTLNDWADAEQDARERPARPIPSGRVSRGRALGLGLGLVVAGIGVAWAGAGAAAGVAAGTVAAAVLAYDGALKDGPAGFLAMGLARGLNVALGVAAAGVGLVEVLAGPVPTVAVPVAATLYVAALTAMAERETAGGAGRPGGARRAVAVVGVAALAAAGVAVGVAAARASPVAVALSVALAAWFLLRVGRPLRAAYADPGPGTVGPAVGACVLSLVVLDAAVAAAAGVGLAAVTLAFLVPATVLSGLFEVS